MGHGAVESESHDQTARSITGSWRFLSMVVPPLFGVLLALISFEVVFRLAHSYFVKPRWSDRPAKFYSADNTTTLQDYYYPHKKLPNEFRIAVLGDSFTFGTSMQFDDTFVKKLERMLNLNSGKRFARVINYGVPGYSTSHEAKLLKAVLKKDSPDLVILQVTLNDPQIKPITPTGLVMKKNQFAEVQHFQSGSIFNHWKSLIYVLDRIHNSQTHTAYIKYYFSLFGKKKTFTNFESSIKRIAKRASRHSVKVVAVVFPLFGLPLNDKYPFWPLHQKVHKVLESAGIEYLDLFKIYKGIPISRLQVDPGADFHPNEIGHRMAAEAIYDWLAEGNLIPQELKIKKWYKVRRDIKPLHNHPLQKTK